MGRRIEATPTTVFAPLVDPSNHSAIDGTGWVRGPLKEGIRLTARQALWRLSVGMEASAEVATAKYWAARGGQRVVHTAQHLHGGVGVDRDYPLHRYFLTAKEIELQLGGTTRQLLSLGRLIAAEPV